MSKWKEIKNDYCNEEEKAIYIDAWKTSKGDEEGHVIAKVFNNGKVEYLNESAKSDDMVQEKIQEALKIWNTASVDTEKNLNDAYLIESLINVANRMPYGRDRETVEQAINTFKKFIKPISNCSGV